MEDMFHIHVEDKIFGADWLECIATEILDAKYDKTDAYLRLLKDSLI